MMGPATLRAQVIPFCEVLPWHSVPPEMLRAAREAVNKKRRVVKETPAAKDRSGEVHAVATGSAHSATVANTATKKQMVTVPTQSGGATSKDSSQIVRGAPRPLSRTAVPARGAGTVGANTDLEGEMGEVASESALNPTAPNVPGREVIRRLGPGVSHPDASVGSTGNNAALQQNGVVARSGDRPLDEPFVGARGPGQLRLPDLDSQHKRGLEGASVGLRTTQDALRETTHSSRAAEARSTAPPPQARTEGAAGGVGRVEPTKSPAHPVCGGAHRGVTESTVSETRGKPRYLDPSMPWTVWPANPEGPLPEHTRAFDGRARLQDDLRPPAVAALESSGAVATEIAPSPDSCLSPRAGSQLAQKEGAARVTPTAGEQGDSAFSASLPVGLARRLKRPTEDVPETDSRQSTQAASQAAEEDPASGSRDPWADAHLLYALQEGKMAPTWGATEVERIKQQLTVWEWHDGELYRRETEKLPLVCVIPPSARVRLVLEAHFRAAHEQADLLTRRLRDVERWWWPDMALTVREVITRCRTCLQSNPAHITVHGEAKAIPVTDPLGRWAIDLLALPTTRRGNVGLCVIVDALTKYPYAEPITSKEATEAARVLMNAIALFGVPLVVQSDNGGEFIAQVSTILLRKMNIDHRLITPGYPQSNGQAENTNRLLVAALRRMAVNNPHDWESDLPAVLHAIRSRSCSTTGYSPFRLLFGRDVSLFGEWRTKSAELQSQLQELAEQERRVLDLWTITLPKARRNVRTAQLRQVRAQNARWKVTPPLTVGQQVWAQERAPADKLQPRFIGPFWVQSIAKNGNYLLRRGNGDVLERSFPRALLKASTAAAGMGGQSEHKDAAEFSAIVGATQQAGRWFYLVQWADIEPTNLEFEMWVPEDNFEDPSMLWQFRKLAVVSEEEAERWRITEEPLLVEEATLGQEGLEIPPPSGTAQPGGPQLSQGGHETLSLSDVPQSVGSSSGQKGLEIPSPDEGAPVSAKPKRTVQFDPGTVKVSKRGQTIATVPLGG